MNRTKYNDINAINQSALKEVSKSPAHFWHYWNNGREQTPAMAFGSAVHCLVLEADKFDKRYLIMDESDKPEPEKDYRIKANREWRDAVYKRAKDEKLKVISNSDFIKAERMRDSCRGIPAIRELLTMQGEFESVHTWKDEEFGTTCKGIADKWIPEKRILIDLKTCNSAHPDKFTRDAIKYNYPLQAAFYTDGWKADSFYIIAVENNAPHCPFLYKLDKDIIQFGRDQYRRYLRAIKECMNKGSFPGYEYWQPAGTYSMELPPWAERSYT